MKFLDKMSLSTLIIGSLLLGLAPFVPEPHLWEKLKMLAAGTLVKPLDIFDLVLHGTLPVLLLLKLLRMRASRKQDLEAD
ncbi:MAG: RND transporter [Gammaproteobacteria bacterium]|nr:RND transporter [Gammaproteobacteria bacterium]